LGPDETVTVNILSGGKPKMPGVIKSLYIALGPDFTSDLLEVETSDHCRMHIALSYNWTFNIERNEEGGRKVFAIKDFIGDMCTVMASKIRSLVAGKTFDDFHKSSAKLIRTAIFGADENGSIYDKFVMASNGLEVTNVDIKSIEPIDQKTRDALKQTVSLAIECVTQQVEDQALRTANLNEQEAEGKLAQMKIKHKTDAESAMIELLKLQAKSRTIKETGEANAMAEAHRTANEINSVGKVDLGKLNVEAWEKMAEANHDRQVQINEVKLSHQKTMSKLRIHKMKETANTETQKFEAIMETLGQETLKEIARVSKFEILHLKKNSPGCNHKWNFCKDLD
jgi:major vault protein